MEATPATFIPVVVAEMNYKGEHWSEYAEQEFETSEYNSLVMKQEEQRYRSHHSHC